MFRTTASSWCASISAAGSRSSLGEIPEPLRQAGAGMPFFAAGRYEAHIPVAGLDAYFWVRERPSTSLITTDSVVSGASPTAAHFRLYQPNRFLWGVSIDSSGRVETQFLVGPTDASGSEDASLDLSMLQPGDHYLATPFAADDAALRLLRRRGKQPPLY